MSAHTKGRLIADDFWMENGARVRVGTSDGSETYYHDSKTVCQCWHDETALEAIVPDEFEIGLGEAEANARRVAACWNAFEDTGIDDPEAWVREAKEALAKKRPDPNACPDCDGTGSQIDWVTSGTGYTTNCLTCDGTGTAKAPGQ